jgi:hypothetical protein
MAAVADHVTGTAQMKALILSQSAKKLILELAHRRGGAAPESRENTSKTRLFKKSR